VKQLQRKLRKGEDIPPYIVPTFHPGDGRHPQLAQGAHAVPALYGCVTGKIRGDASVKDPECGIKTHGLSGRLSAHGLRATFSTACNEIGYPPEWIEA
jgi:hypothetical protein